MKRKRWAPCFLMPLRCLIWQRTKTCSLLWRWTQRNWLTSLKRSVEQEDHFKADQKRKVFRPAHTGFTDFHLPYKLPGTCGCQLLKIILNVWSEIKIFKHFYLNILFSCIIIVSVHVHLSNYLNSNNLSITLLFHITRIFHTKAVVFEILVLGVWWDICNWDVARLGSWEWDKIFRL